MYRARLCLLLLLFTALSPALPAFAADGEDYVELGRKATAFVISEAPGGGGTGSAFCIDSSGIFITNDHVVTHRGKVAPKVTVVVSPGTRQERRIPATVLKTDPERDVAILQVRVPGMLETVELAPPASTKKLTNKTKVLALGFPLGTDLSLSARLPEVTVSTGHVTAIGVDEQRIIKQIQFDGSINPGNSGGALLDENGRVIGVVYAIVRGQNLNLAKPVYFVWDMLDEANVVLTPRILMNPAAGDNYAAFLASKPEGREAAPSAEQFKTVQALIRKTNAERYADRSFDAGRPELIRDMIDHALELKDDPKMTYGMLMEARELSLAIGYVDAAYYATVFLIDKYDVDSLTLMSEVIRTLSPGATDPQDNMRCASVGLAVLEAQARRGDFEDLRRLLPMVQNNIARTKNQAVIVATRDRFIRLQGEVNEASKVAAAMETLKRSPNDAAANLAVGRYYCFNRKEYSKGLPMLLKGADPGLKKIAETEMTFPSTADQQRLIGDLWYDQIAREAKASAAHDQCRLRAATWYRMAEPELTGLKKVAVNQRLAELPQLPQAKPKPAAEGDNASQQK